MGEAATSGAVHRGHTACPRPSMAWTGKLRSESGCDLLRVRTRIKAVCLPGCSASKGLESGLPGAGASVDGVGPLGPRSAPVT